MLALLLAPLFASLGPAPEPDARLFVLAPGPATPGTSVELSVTIREAPEPGTPIELWLSSDDMPITDNRFDVRDVVDPHAAQPRLRARATAPAQPGSYVVNGELRWVTCTGPWCRTQRADVAWTLEVAVPTPP